MGKGNGQGEGEGGGEEGGKETSSRLLGSPVTPRRRPPLCAARGCGGLSLAGRDQGDGGALRSRRRGGGRGRRRAAAALAVVGRTAGVVRAASRANGPRICASPSVTSAAAALRLR